MLIWLVLVCGLFLLLASVVWLAWLFRRVVPTNMVHIVQSAKRTAVYGRGKEAGNVYYAWPAWLPVIGVTVIEFPESIFQINLVNYEAYDVARLPFMVDVSAFFRIAQADTAAQRVSSFAELEEQLSAVVQGSVRRILATNALENILQDRSTLGEQFTLEVTTQIKEWGVDTVKMIEFMDLRDSSKGKVIENIMEKEKSRIERESRMAVADNLRQAQQKEIEAQRIVEVERQSAEQTVGQRTAEKEREVGIASQQAQQEIKKQEAITQEHTMQVVRVEKERAADIERQVVIIEAEAKKKAGITAAEQERQVAITMAEGEKQSTVLKAEGNLQATLKAAEGIEAQGKASGEAEKAMQLAPVAAQLELAREIGSNHPYQSYLISIEQIKVSERVGIELAKAMAQADLKVIVSGVAGEANGKVPQAVAGLADMFSVKGGTQLTGMLSALSQTPEGKALVDKITASATNPDAGRAA